MYKLYIYTFYTLPWPQKYIEVVMIDKHKLYPVDHNN